MSSDPVIETNTLNELRSIHVDLIESKAVTASYEAQLNLIMVRTLHAVNRDPQLDLVCLACGTVFRIQDRICPLCNDPKCEK
jgi:rubrerythrin